MFIIFKFINIYLVICQLCIRIEILNIFRIQLFNYLDVEFFKGFLRGFFQKNIFYTFYLGVIN